MRHCRILLFLAVAATGIAQVDRSTLTGTVHDATGGAVPNAQVLARNSATGIERTSRASGHGVYLLPDLSIGTYSVTFSDAGFQSALYEELGRASCRERV